MAQTYKGYQIPAYTDVADAVVAFEEFVDSMKSGLPDVTGNSGRVLTNDGAAAHWGPKLTISTAQPTGGNDGDVWYVTA